MEIKAKKTWDARLARPAAACTRPCRHVILVQQSIYPFNSSAHCRLLRWSGWWCRAGGTRVPSSFVYPRPSHLPCARTSSVSLPLLAVVFVLCPRVDVDLETPAPQEENVPRPALGLPDG